MAKNHWGRFSHSQKITLKTEASVFHTLGYRTMGKFWNNYKINQFLTRKKRFIVDKYNELECPAIYPKHLTN